MIFNIYLLKNAIFQMESSIPISLQVAHHNAHKLKQWVCQALYPNCHTQQDFRQSELFGLFSFQLFLSSGWCRHQPYSIKVFLLVATPTDSEKMKLS